MKFHEKTPLPYFIIITNNDNINTYYLEMHLLFEYAKKEMPDNHLLQLSACVY